MTRFLAAAMVIVIIGGPTDATVRKTAKRSAAHVKPEPNPILQIMAAAEERERHTILDVCEFLPTPQPQVARFINSQLRSDPNYRMAQLLDEIEDLRQARKAMAGFWMNNQPSVLTYEWLNGAIGP